jgi:hypothetical protein
MCDYSLELVASRPARAGDKLVTTTFPNTITRGFASSEEQQMAVCLLPGTELAFDEEVKCERCSLFRSRLPIGHKLARFRQVNRSWSRVHHDALEFPDGQIVLLTQLCEGQRATVLQLPVTARVAADEQQKYDSLAL